MMNVKLDYMPPVSFRFGNSFCFALQLPGLVFEPLVFAILAYWLAGLRDDTFAFLMTAAIVILTMNVSTACGK